MRTDRDLLGSAGHPHDDQVVSRGQRARCRLGHDVAGGRSDPAAAEVVFDNGNFSVSHTVAQMNALLDSVTLR
ncbi:MAG: hypothetical protein R2709_08830 [Marmoricola sp.]